MKRNTKIKILTLLLMFGSTFAAVSKDAIKSKDVINKRKPVEPEYIESPLFGFSGSFMHIYQNQGSIDVQGAFSKGFDVSAAALGFTVSTLWNYDHRFYLAADFSWLFLNTILINGTGYSNLISQQYFPINITWYYEIMNTNLLFGGGPGFFIARLVNNNGRVNEDSGYVDFSVHFATMYKVNVTKNIDLMARYMLFMNISEIMRFGLNRYFEIHNRFSLGALYRL